MTRVYIETYGCQMNEYDTEIAQAVLKDDGFALAETPQEAEIVLLNTCSVRENANRKIYGRVHALRHIKSDLKIGIMGCMATNFKEKLLENNNLGIDFVIGPDSYRRIGQILSDSKENPDEGFDVKLSKTETYEDIYPIRQNGVNAWIAIMRGCNNFCSFCVVPYTRGRERSRSPLSVVKETEQLVKEGFKQVTLLGQNVNSYQYEEQKFADLLQIVAQVDGLERIRFTSPHPKDFPLDLIKVMAENDKICKHIHLPLQAGNSRILDVMRRTYTKEEYLKLVEDIRNVIPNVVLTTDIIIGFPTETDDEFQDTVDVMQKVEYDSAFIFKYSEREGTLAAKKYDDDVPEDKKTERIMLLNEIQKAHSLKKNLAHVGETQRILVESEETKKSDQDVQGRNDGNKLVIIPQNGYKVGQFVDVKITDATAHVLKGSVV